MNHQQPAALVCAIGVVLFLAGCSTPPPAKIAKVIEEPIDFAKRGRLVDGPEGARLIFPDRLLFEFGKSTLSPEASRNVDACKFILERARGTIIVEGHTDDVGSKAINLKLSRERAETVRAALIERKVAPSRIEVRALGDSRPEIPNAATDEQRAFNRRAEIIFKGDTVSSLDAPHGCGDPPVQKTIMVDAPVTGTPTANATQAPLKQLTGYERLQMEIKAAIENATRK